MAAALPGPPARRGRAQPSEQPDAVVVARETIELTFIALIQLLPARQRAVVILRDVLDWSAAETAALLDISVASANSALQRGRATLRDELPRAPVRAPGSADVLSEEEQRLLAGFIAAHEAGDAEASAALMREDIRVTMPPHPMVFDGRDAIAPLLATAFGPEGMGDWRLVPTRANRDAGRRQLPAQARRDRVARVQARRPARARTAGSPRSRRSTRRCSSSSACRVLEDR